MIGHFRSPEQILNLSNASERDGVQCVTCAITAGGSSVSALM